MNSAPLCFVLMPFGRKANSDGSMIDFDRVYADLIDPAIRSAALQPLRADQETLGGVIHKPMFERLILCPFAVADLTSANANVYYELGVRHAFRPWSTVLLVAEGTRLPFDVQLLRTIFYKLGPDGGPDPDGIADAKATLTKFIEAAKGEDKDSPIFQLLDNLNPPIVDHLKTDVFREQVEYSATLKQKLATARTAGADAIRQAEKDLGDLANVEVGVIVDLYLSYRGASAWNEMVALVDHMPKPLSQTALVQEQLGLALNRLKRREEAEKVLTDLIAEKGPSSETYGILGRVYKDRWDDELKAGNKFAAAGFLKNAIETYLRGFEADWRDAYPGINAVTLMELKDPPDKRAKQIIPVVRYAVERKIAKGTPDYWDYATLVELAVLGQQQEPAEDSLGSALAKVREKWEPATTARNLQLLREARERRPGGSPPWAKDIEDELIRRSNA